MPPKDKATLMATMRVKRAVEGLVRKEVYIHKDWTRADLDKAVKRLTKPPKDTTPPGTPTAP